jgi:hypothetical protein
MIDSFYSTVFHWRFYGPGNYNAIYGGILPRVLFAGFCIGVMPWEQGITH